MNEPLAIDAAHFFEFMAMPGLKVVLVSLHPLHAFNGVLSRQLAADHDVIAHGTVDLRDLIVAGGPAVPFLHDELRRCGAPGGLGVLPGYCLFRGARMLAWDAGVPAFADVEAIGRSALVGAVFASVTCDLAFVRQALHMAAEHAAAQRVASRFREAAANAAADHRTAGQPGPPPIDDLRWACEVLGVRADATDREVHDAWRRRRIDNHPDLARDAVEFDRRSRISADINRARDIIVQCRAGEAGRAAYARAS